jgi:hypothetical protein
LCELEKEKAILINKTLTNLAIALRNEYNTRVWMHYQATTQELKQLNELASSLIKNQEH